VRSNTNQGSQVRSRTSGACGQMKANEKIATDKRAARQEETPEEEGRRRGRTPPEQKTHNKKKTHNKITYRLGKKSKLRNGNDYTGNNNRDPRNNLKNNLNFSLDNEIDLLFFGNFNSKNIGLFSSDLVSDGASGNLWSSLATLLTLVELVKATFSPDFLERFDPLGVA
jgi:hypothetical protein